MLLVRCGVGRLLGDTAAATLRIQELSKGTPEILLCRGQAELHTFSGHFLIKGLQIRDVEAELEAPSWVPLRRGM
jgi:hypothetical protein